MAEDSAPVCEACGRKGVMYELPLNNEPIEPWWECVNPAHGSKFLTWED